MLLTGISCAHGHREFLIFILSSDLSKHQIAMGWENLKLLM